jgi:uncharacterized membrane protein
VQPSILLVFGIMQGLGFSISTWSLVKYTVPVVIASVVLGFVQFSLFDRFLSRTTETRR